MRNVHLLLVQVSNSWSPANGSVCRDYGTLDTAFLEEVGVGFECIGYFSVAMIKHCDLSNLMKREFILASGSRWVRVHDSNVKENWGWYHTLKPQSLNTTGYFLQQG